MAASSRSFVADLFSVAADEPIPFLPIPAQGQPNSGAAPLCVPTTPLPQRTARSGSVVNITLNGGSAKSPALARSRSGSISSAGGVGSGAKKATQGGQFKSQLANLMATIGLAKAEYIRCIKPNSAKVIS